MPNTVRCPQCGHKVDVDEHVGTSVVCPTCKYTFVPPGQAGERPSSIQRDEPAPWTSRPRETYDDSSLSGREFARQAGIDPREEHDESVSGKSTAESRLAEWKQDMPEVPSAYKPSGKLPGAAVLAMSAGVPLAAVASALTFLIAGAITLGLTGLLVGLVALIAACGWVVCIVVVVTVLVAVGGGVLTYYLQGYAAAGVTTWAGTFGKNRNVPAAVCFSLLSCALGLVLAGVASSYLGDYLLAWLEPDLAARRNEGGTWMDVLD